MINALKGRRRELCPFCFEYFPMGDTPFRCASPMSRCEPLPDDVLAKHWGDTRPVGRVLDPRGRFTRTIKCSECHLESRKRLCPECHSDLPHTTGDYRNYIFAVIGAKEAGKSHYIAVLIDQIKRRVGPNLDMLLSEMSDDTIRRYRSEFYDPVFRDGRIIRATTSALADRRVQRPLVYSLIFNRNGPFGRKRKDAVVLVFFDTAGEDLNDEDTMSTVNKYIYRSDGILLLIDPLQLPMVRDRLGGEEGLPGVNTETDDIMTRTTRLVQKGRNLKQTDRIQIPLALAFSKFDAVGSLVDDQFQLKRSANHDGGFDVQDFDAVNSEMKALLEEWGQQNLVNQIRTGYARHGFFGLSALGCNPHGADGMIPRVAPRRVEDPFLWLLAANGLVRELKS